MLMHSYDEQATFIVENGYRVEYTFVSFTLGAELYKDGSKNV